MIALIVSDSEHETALFETYAKEAGYDTIIYNWLVKAMDNIEEISPDIVILNAVDFPMHWKVFVWFAKSFSAAQIILYVPENFSETEEAKAKYLGIKEIVYGVSKIQDIDFSALVNAKTDKEFAKLIFLDPNDGKICTGSGEILKNTLDFFPDRNIQLLPGDILEDVMIKTNKGIQNVQATVSALNKDSLTLNIKAC